MMIFLSPNRVFLVSDGPFQRQYDVRVCQASSIKIWVNLHGGTDADVWIFGGGANEDDLAALKVRKKRGKTPKSVVVMLGLDYDLVENRCPANSARPDRLANQRSRSGRLESVTLLQRRRDALWHRRAGAANDRTPPPARDLRPSEAL